MMSCDPESAHRPAMQSDSATEAAHGSPLWRLYMSVPVQSRPCARDSLLDSCQNDLNAYAEALLGIEQQAPLLWTIAFSLHGFDSADRVSDRPGRRPSRDPTDPRRRARSRSGRKLAPDPSEGQTLNLAAGRGRVAHRTRGVLGALSHTARRMRCGCLPASSLNPDPRPTVTVVIPCFNYGRFLPFAVHSALTQRDVEVDVVIVDDASTDDSLQVARELAAECPEYRDSASTNQGPVATFGAMDCGSYLGSLLLRLDADDMLTPGAPVTRNSSRAGISQCWVCVWTPSAFC